MDEKLRILVIDDDEIDRMTVHRSLKKAGLAFNLEEATGARAGLEILGSQNFDCVFLDYLLPDGDGLAVLREARSANIATPIIMLTGHGDERLAVEMIRAGATDYVPKSEVSPESLSKSLHSAIQIHLAEVSRQRAEEELQKSNKRIVDILESISDAFFAISGDWSFTYLNTQAESLLQKSRAELIEQNIWTALPDIPSWFSGALSKAMRQKEPVNSEGFYDPLGIWLEFNVYPGQEGVSVYFRDITERKKVEERLSFLANFDSLTGLPNRVLLMDRLEQSLSRVLWHGRMIALLFCDLDRFKLVNDTFGHDVGDHLLKVVAERFKGCVREGDTVARLGGDEFVILLNDVSKVDDIGKIAQKIINCVSVPITLAGCEVFVTASIGIAVAPTDGKDPTTLMKHADIAMYHGKELGKNNYQLYSNTHDSHTSDRLIMESALRIALMREELLVHYQPQINLHTGRIIGAEALVRWQHPERGLLSPAEFLPLAEETDLIASIDKWVLQTACIQNKAWQDAGFPPIRIAVNLSDRFFKLEGLTQIVATVLKETGLSADALELELTEEIMMHDMAHSLATLDELRATSVTLAIDDFGTGYSSLGHLKRCPIQRVKIDRSFIKDILTDPNDAAITEAIIAMSHKLNLTVLAEGVETKGQQEYLTQLGCDEMQGFLLSRPVPAEDFWRVLGDVGDI